jgi:hypothetical protein
LSRPQRSIQNKQERHFPNFEADQLISRLPFQVSEDVRQQLIRVSLLDHFGVDYGSGESQFTDGFLCRFPTGEPEVLPEPIRHEWLLPDSVSFKAVTIAWALIVLNISATDDQVVSSFPLLNPIETMFDANIYIRSHPEVLALAFQPLCGFHGFLALDWADHPATRSVHRNAHTDLSFEEWMARTREQADKWLAQTDHPPLWRPGFEPGTWV